MGPVTERTPYQSLEDCYMLARRRLGRLRREPQDLVDRRDEIEQWEHIILFCERAGLRSSVLRMGDDR